MMGLRRAGRAPRLVYGCSPKTVDCTRNDTRHNATFWGSAAKPDRRITNGSSELPELRLFHGGHRRDRREANLCRMWHAGAVRGSQKPSGHSKPGRIRAADCGYRGGLGLRTVAGFDRFRVGACRILGRTCHSGGRGVDRCARSDFQGRHEARNVPSGYRRAATPCPSEGEHHVGDIHRFVGDLSGRGCVSLVRLGVCSRRSVTTHRPSVGTPFGLRPAWR